MGTIFTIDLGTTSFKAALFDSSLKLIAVARVPTPVHVAAAGWREILPEAFFRAIQDLAGLLRTQNPSGYSSIGMVTFSTQTNSFILLDGRDCPLTPLILWSDERARHDFSSEEDFRIAAPSVTGLPSVGALAAPAKLKWMAKHQPEILAATRRFCLIGDFLTLWFTGRHVSEAGATGFTGLLDIHQLSWCPEVEQGTGFSRSCLPSVLRAGADLGAIRSEAAEALTMNPSCRFFLGCLDQYAGAVGAGNTLPGAVSETTGTVLTTIQCSDRFSEMGGGYYQGPAFREGWYWKMMVAERGASLLEAFRNAQPDRPEFPVLDAEAASTPPGAEGLRLVAPIGTNPRDAFSGISTHHNRGHFARAIMEAVAFALASQIQILCANPPSELRCCGGANRSRVWLQIKADVLNIPCAPPACDEPACLGAAVLAVRSLGGVPDAHDPSLRDPADWIFPRPGIHRFYKSLLTESPKLEKPIPNP